MRTLLTILFSLLASTVHAGQPLGARPDINDYQDREAFIRDVLAWEKHKAEMKGLPSRITDRPEVKSDWHHITGPEDLDTAITNAKGYVQPNYTQTYRFNRTTHLSFPFSPLKQEQLAEKRVEAPDSEVDANLLPGNLTPQPEQPFITEERLFSENLQQRLSVPSVNQSPSVQTRMD